MGDEDSLIQVQVREQSNRLVGAIDMSAVPRIGETIHLAADKARKVLDIIHAVDPSEHIVICVVAE